MKDKGWGTIAFSDIYMGIERELRLRGSAVFFKLISILGSCATDSSSLTYSASCTLLYLKAIISYTYNMPLRGSGVSLRQLQLDLRASSLLADMEENFARSAEIEIQRSATDARLAEAAVQLSINIAREFRAAANRSRTVHYRLVSEVLDLEPQRRRLASAQHEPAEAGRYFRTALQDIVDARASANRLRENDDQLTEETERLANQAIEIERLVEELRRRDPNDPRVIEVAGQAEHARLAAEDNCYQCQTFARQSEQYRHIAVEAAQTLVAVSTANPENPPYLDPTQIATHQAIIHTARQVLVCDRVSYDSLRGQELEGAQRWRHRAFQILADMAQAALAEFPYPQGPPGQIRTKTELDEFFQELPHPNVNDLEPENRNCHICQEPYGMDGPENGSQGSVCIKETVVEYPVKLPWYVFSEFSLSHSKRPLSCETCIGSKWLFSPDFYTFNAVC